jgi:hypothetical protein
MGEAFKMSGVEDDSIHPMLIPGGADGSARRVKHRASEGIIVRMF